MDGISRTVLSAAVATAAVVLLAASVQTTVAVNDSNVRFVTPAHTSKPANTESQQAALRQEQLAIRSARIRAASRALAPARYVVRLGDTLSSIAARQLGSAARWPALWYANRSQVHNPDAISAGVSLVEPPASLGGPAILKAALAAIPKVVVRTVAAVAPHSSFPASSSGGSDIVSSWSAYKQCVAMHESGDGRALQNPTSTASGWFGFLTTTWRSVMHLPGPAKDYSLALQSRAFDILFSESGRAPWITDGC